MDTQVNEAQRLPSTRRYAQPALAVTLLVILAAGVIGRLAGIDRLGAAGLLVFVLVGPGAAIVAFSRLPGGLAGRLCIAFGLSVTLVTGISLITLYLDAWAPTPTLAVIAALAAVVLLVAALRPSQGPGRHSDIVGDEPDFTADENDVADPVPGGMTRERRWWLVAEIVAAALCLVGVLVSRTGNPPIGGFLRTVNPIWYVGIAVLAVAATAAFFSRDETAARRPTPMSAALFLCSTIAATPVIIYGTPRSQSAEKHVQLSELIASTHELKASQTIYNDWPGLFTASAWLKDFCGIGDLISLATWWPVVLILFRLLAMRLLAGVFVKNDRQAWLASTIVFLATPGGIDYYSPQAIGYTVGLIVLWIGVSKAFTLRAQCVLVFVLACGIVVTHQLTPYIVTGGLVVLAIFRQLSRWWLPALVAVPTVVWTGIHFDQVQHFISPSAVGSTSNFSLPSQRATSNPGLLVNGAIAFTAAAVVLVGLFALATLIRNRRTSQAWGLAIASLVGFVAVFINAYGNEGTFRAVFFAMPWITILAVTTISALHLGRLRPHFLGRAVTALIIVLIPLSFVGAYVLDGSTTIRRGDRDYLIGLRDRAVADPSNIITVVSLGDADYPGVKASVVRNYTLFRATLASLVRTTPPTSPRFAEELGRQLAPLVAPKRNATLYALSSPAVDIYEDEYGQVTLQQSRQIRAALNNSPVWTRVFNRDGTSGYRLNLAAISG